jgi:hypothetical protein
MYSRTRLNEEKKSLCSDGFAPSKDEFENNQFSVYFVTKSTIEILTYMSGSRTNFVKQLQENQNIIHKICRYILMVTMHIRICFRKLRFNYGKLSQNLEASKFSTWAYRALNTAITVPKTKRSINTVEFEVDNIS